MIRTGAPRLALMMAMAWLPDPLMAQSVCAPLVERLEAAARSGQLDRLSDTEAAVFGEPTCTGAQRARAKRIAALAYVQAANAAPTEEERLRLLETGRRFAEPWQLMASIGDIRRERKDHANASVAYQAALGDIADPGAVPSPPPPEVVTRFVRLAGQERAVAASFVRGDRLITRSVRNIIIDAAPVPIQFEYNSEQMTPLGREYADDLWRLLDAQQRPRITLIGHTDQRGSDTYNLELSRRRAEAIRKLLIEKGYPAANVTAQGRGEGEPLCIEGLAQYSQEQVWQMLRRVEVRFEGGPAPTAVAGSTCQTPPKG